MIFGREPLNFDPLKLLVPKPGGNFHHPLYSFLESMTHTIYYMDLKTLFRR